MTYKFIPCLLLLFAHSARADIEAFEIDPVHTRVAFMVSHAGFSNAIGTFSGSTGEVVFDENDWSQSSVSANIPLANLDLGDPNWQKKILDGTFFDAGKFPAATFVSQRIEKLSPTTGVAHGLLSIRGSSQPVSLGFSLNALKRHPLTLKKTIGFSATATLSRKAFGMGAWASVVGDEVKIIIELEATRKKTDATRENSNGNKK